MRVFVFRIALFVSCAAALAACAAACHSSSPAQRQPERAAAQKGGPPPVAAATSVVLATLEDDAVRESSGLAASRRHADILWTHNDSGDGPFVYAFDRAGRSRGTFRVEGAQAYDWEDIAAGPGPEAGLSYLYAADIGDNERRRAHLVVYRFPEPEPVPAGAAATKGAPRPTAPAAAIRLKYPDGAHNAEALLVHPKSGDIYVVTKSTDGAGVYKMAAPASAEGFNTLALVARLRGPDIFGTLVTGGDISPDGRRAALCDYAQGYELTLPEGSRNFDDIWRQTPTAVPLGLRLIGEAIAYRPDGAALLATSERRNTPIIEVVLR